MTRRRVEGLVIAVVFLPLLALLLPGSPLYLVDLLTPSGAGHNGHPTSHWISALKTDDGTARREAIFAIGATAAEAGEDVPALADILAQDPDPNTRREAALALSKMAPASRAAVPALARAVDDEEPWVRMNAVHALTWLKTEARPAIPALTKALTREGNRTRLAFTHSIQEAAAVALGRASAGSAEAVPALTEALRTADTDTMRGAAARGLGFVGAQAQTATPLLRDLLD